jgi:hypothetical protein
LIKNTGLEKQQHYQKKIVSFQGTIKNLLKIEQTVLDECRADPSNAVTKLFDLAEKMLDLSSNYLILNGISAAVLGARNEEALGEAKKSLSKAIIYLENIVTARVDAPFSDFDEVYQELEPVSISKRGYIVRKMGLTVTLLESAYGDNTKWKWTFVDIEGRFAAIAKNLLDMKRVCANTDPSSPDYEPLLYHLHYVKKLLSDAAVRFHDRYELLTKRSEDLHKAANFLSALHRLHVLFNEHQEAEQVKKKYDNWMSGFDTQSRKQNGAPKIING